MSLMTHLIGSPTEKPLHSSHQRANPVDFAQGNIRSGVELMESDWNANHSDSARYPSYVNGSRRLLDRCPEEIVSLGKAISFGEYFQVGGNQHCFSANIW
jgi:hypothetical protein